MPRDWGDEPRRRLHYDALGKPVEAQTFMCALKARLVESLMAFNRTIPQLTHVRIFHPNKQEERGLWALAKLERTARSAQPEPHQRGDQHAVRDFGLAGCVRRS